MFKRIILIVLDGVGIGALPDADGYNDQDAATLQNVARATGGLSLPNLESLGLGNIASVQGLRPVTNAQGWWGKMAERSPGKDSVTGHWELAGLVLAEPFATFPHGFPAEIIKKFSRLAGCQPLGNVAASGTDILRDLGEEHLRTGRPIVYTSADSVFQIAAHEEVMSPEQLYRLCRETEIMLTPYRVCRVIARPFLGTSAATFYRTSGRHDFPRKPQEATLLERLSRAGISTCGIGKIHDLYAGQGLTKSLPTVSNRDGMEKIIAVLSDLKEGLVMANLVDFDMLYGHRLDAAGFAAALEEFDAWIPRLLGCLEQHDLLLITADHGCDPTTAGTDHTREYVPLLAWHTAARRSGSLGIRETFADVGATIAENFSVEALRGLSFLNVLNDRQG